MKWINKGHEFDSVSHLLIGKTDVFIWGYCGIGIELCQTLIYLRKLGINWNVSFIDSDPGKQNTANFGSKVYPPSYLQNINVKESFVVVCASKNNIPVITELAKSYGFSPDENVFDHEYFGLTLLSVHLVYNFNKVYFSTLNFVPSTVCNLNCNACLNFNPYIKKHTTYEIASLKKSIDVLFQKVDLIGRFQVTGGEPLLYREIDELLDYIGENYRSKMASFELISNGTIIPSENTMNLLRKHNVRVYLDDYEMSLTDSQYKFKEIYYLLKNNYVDVYHNYICEWFDFTSTAGVHAESTEEELRRHFDKCGCPFSSLVGTKIVSCNYALYSYRAGLVDYYEDEYYDLETVTDENKTELVEFRSRYNSKGFVEFCRHCDGFDGNNLKVKPAVQIPRRKGDLTNE